jgi:hypothetical protein
MYLQSCVRYYWAVSSWISTSVTQDIVECQPQDFQSQLQVRLVRMQLSGADDSGANISDGTCAQVVIVSPLMRALETAAGAFGGGPFKGSGRPLMLAQSGEPDERAAHCAVACPEGIPFIAFEGCRERLGVCPHCVHAFVCSAVAIKTRFALRCCWGCLGRLVSAPVERRHQTWRRRM